MLSPNIGVGVMLGTFTIPVSYLVSVLRYSEQINIFCLGGSILLILGLSRILLSS